MTHDSILWSELVSSTFQRRRPPIIELDFHKWQRANLHGQVVALPNFEPELIPFSAIRHATAEVIDHANQSGESVYKAIRIPGLDKN